MTYLWHLRSELRATVELVQQSINPTRCVTLRSRQGMEEDRKILGDLDLQIMIATKNAIESLDRFFPYN